MEQQKTNKKETKIPELKMIPGLEIFDRHDYLNGRGLYVSLFGKIPNLFEISNINTEDFTNFFKEKYSEAILKEYCYKTNIKKDKEEYEDAVYLLKGELLLQINSQNYLEIYSQAQSLNDLSELFEDIKKFRRKKRKAKNEISLIVPCHGSLGTERVKFKKPKINLEENYNDDFLEIHQNVVQQLNKKQESGL
ncbi:MAG TPA: hypothetical protein VFM70_00405, partial [Salinimicrobium sp.]|nr:hypothetical protein [Salinimicrobium sp.]